MTKIKITYNPFLIRTKILVDEKEVAETSNLYRYRSTPLEDWIDKLVHELVDYCNDDEIEISYEGVQKYGSAIEKAIKTYCKKNRSVEIDYDDTITMGYRGRLAKLSQIRQQIAEQLSEKERVCFDEDIMSSDNADIDIIFVSNGNVDAAEKFVTSMLGIKEYNVESGYIFADVDGESDEDFTYQQITIPFYEDKYIRMRFIVLPDLLECSNAYWRFLKNTLNGNGEYMLVSMLNKRAKKNDELLEYVVKQYEVKGKNNKERFIFLTEDKEESKEYLYDQYDIKGAVFFMPDEIEECREQIVEHINTVCYAKQIAYRENSLERYILDQKTRLQNEAEMRKASKELEDEEIELHEITGQLREFLGSVHVTRQNDYEKIAGNIADKYKTELIQSICVRRERYSRNSSWWALDKVMSRYLGGRIEGVSDKQEKLKHLPRQLFIGIVCDMTLSFLSECSIDTDLELHNNLENKGVDLSVWQNANAWINKERICDEALKFTDDVVGSRKKGVHKETFFTWILSGGYLDYDNFPRRITPAIEELKKDICTFLEKVEQCVLVDRLNAFNNHLVERLDGYLSQKTEEFEQRRKKLTISEEDMVKIRRTDELLEQIKETIAI